ncbi:MAG: DUF59 domain-containing protein [Bacteroidetes bacterium]|nr:DUF59 domain-containing protein [Bacteroidota bacterium]
MPNGEGAAAKGGDSVKGGDNAVGDNLRDLVEDTLRTVFDPEIPVNIFDLGLVYEIRINEGGKIKITMTLTAPACPVAGDIVQDVQQKIEAIEGVTDCHVQLTFDPPWTKEMMTEEAKLELGFL